ncbi:MAG: hypothetical protein K5Q00_02955 [Gammaproteobacteria bacterium]|nr:hypothetical protein [Gammaproteobacteria bacterium]
MRRYVLLIIFLIAVVWLGVELRTNPSYALIVTQHWVVETSLGTAIIFAIIGFLALYGVTRLVRYSHLLSDRWRTWSKRRRKVKAIKQTNQGLIELAEGHWPAAEKLLQQAANNSDEPLLNYLALAFAAQGQHAYDRAVKYFNKAHEVEPEANLAIDILQAQLQINHRQYELALTTLTRLYDVNQKQQQVLRLLTFVHLKLHNWRTLKDLLPLVKKYSGYPKEKFNKIAATTYQHLFEQITNVTDAQLVWEHSKAQITNEPKVVEAYVQCLINHKADAEAEEVVAHYFKKNWSSELAAQYGEIYADNEAQFNQAQKWLADHPQDANLLLALGQLAQRNQLWAQARDYYQASVVIQPSANTYWLLGQLFEQQLNDTTQSRECYRQGLELLI